MKLNNKLYVTISLVVVFICSSCEDFVDIEAPTNKLIREEVFNNKETAFSALKGIYNQLAIAAFSSGANSSVSFLSGLSADNVKTISANLARIEFEQNELLPDNQFSYNLWSSAYNIIYLANSFLEGITESNQIDNALKEQWEGEVRFIRALTYFYLTNLYGEVPLILHSDYRNNVLAERDSQSEIYSAILDDLHNSVNLLPDNYTRGERTEVNSFAAKSLLARVYLFQEDWEMAEKLSSEVIAENSLYEISDDMDEVFKANSKEALWQITPEGRGNGTTYTEEGGMFIIDPVFTFFSTVKLNEDFVNEFGEMDRRLTNWIGYNPNLDAYFSYKYKIRVGNATPIEEYSMGLRFAEQYLIRAEAKAQQGRIAEALEDLDIIQKRAGSELTSETLQGISQENLLFEILKERRKELFTEWGHRWLDLKRTGFVEEIIGENNPLWERTDIFYPIPEQERMNNPNLSQNDGY